MPWRAHRTAPLPRYSIAVLHNPQDKLPPSKPATIERLVRVGAQMGLEVEPIRRQDFLRLGEFDALFIRETTALTNHTYRFARKAEREGLAVIDDPVSIARCTNKVYLAELLAAQGLPTPKTVVLDRRHLKAIGSAARLPDRAQGARRLVLARRVQGHGRGRARRARRASCSRIPT